jgi:L-amino acid N-acyltransferase YncA
MRETTSSPATNPLLTGAKLVRFTPELRPALDIFYDSFEVKGAALGLPPRTAELQRQWLDSLMPFHNFVVLDGERVAGHATLCPEVYTGEVAVFIHQDYRGYGLGRRLLQALIAEALDLHLRRIWGVAEPDNLPMLRLAASCGFVPSREAGEFFLELENLAPQAVAPIDTQA